MSFKGPYKPRIENLFGLEPVLTGGTRTFEVASITGGEQAAFRHYFEKIVKQMRRVSIPVAEDFERQYPFFRDSLCIAKARFDNKPLNVAEVAELPRAGQIGVGAIFPMDLDLIVTTPAISENRNLWDLAAIAGTIRYIIPTVIAPPPAGAPAWWHTASVVEARSMIAIMQNGIVEIDSEPCFNQFRWETQAGTYVPWRADILVSQSITENKAVYQYHTPTGFIITPDLGVRLSAMPVLTKTVSPMIIGLIFFEYGYYNALTYR